MTDRLTIDELAHAYEGLERSEAFDGAEGVAGYRASVLERNADQAAFVAERLGEDAAVLEVGCGNGRLLVDLARRGRCGRGLGVDLAESRIAFAREWAHAERLDALRFEAADALRHDWGTGTWDAALCVTSAFAYFEPLGDGLALELARRMRAALRSGGTLVVEVYPHVAWRRMMEVGGNELRLWHELPADDPWRFYLSALRLDGEILTHEKTFVHRIDGTVDSGRREQLFLYTADSLTAVLEQAGFTGITTHGGWDGRSWGDDEILIAVGQAA